MRTPDWGFVIDEVACLSKNPSLSAKRKADRNSNLFEGLSAFSFCKDARGSARDGQSQSLIQIKNRLKRRQAVPDFLQKNTQTGKGERSEANP